MILRILASLVVLCLAAGVCLAAKPVTDGAIYDNVLHNLAVDVDVKGGALKVDVKDGVVTLAGDLETQSQKDKATKIARKVKGVKRVENNIEVKRRG